MPICATSFSHPDVDRVAEVPEEVPEAVGVLVGLLQPEEINPRERPYSISVNTLIKGFGSNLLAAAKVFGFGTITICGL